MALLTHPAQPPFHAQSWGSCLSDFIAFCGLFLSISGKLNLAAADLAQLTAAVCSSLELDSELHMLCKAGAASAADAVAFASLDDVPAKAKAQIWLCPGAAAPAVEAAAAAVAADPATCSEEPVFEPEPPLAEAPAPVERRDLTLLVAKNELVPSARKLA
eukprot:SAG22_NODE_8116_length_681_cov_6.989691_2_plen_159_part_01